MIFKSIELKNFRQYKDSKITFDKKINIIEAGNGVGKSTLMAGLIFVLYGYEAVVNSDFIQVTESNPLINLDCINENCTLKDPNEEIEVTLICESSAKVEYRIKRTYKPTTNSDIVKAEKKDENTNYMQSDVSMEEIERLLPEEFTPLLFFNGERIKKIEDSFSSKADGLKEEVEKILKIKEYNEAKNLIGRSIKRINSDANFKNPKIKELANKIEAWEKYCDQREVYIENGESTLEQLKSEIEQLEEALKEREEHEEAMEKIQSLKREIAQNNEKYEQYEMKAREQILKNYPDLIKISTFEKILKQIYCADEYYNITGIEQSAIDKIIENGVCICKTPLDNEKKYQLKELRKTLPPESFQTVLNVKLDNKEENKESLKEYIEDYAYQAGEALEKCETLRIQEKRINDGVSQRAKDMDAKEINNKREEKEIELKKIESNIIIWQNEEKKVKLNIDLKKREYEKELDKEKKKEIEKISIHLLQGAEEKLKEEIEKRKHDLKYHMEKRVNKFANELLFDEVEINLDNGLRPRKIRLENGAEELSTGQSVMVCLSYLFALMETSKDEEDYGHKEKLTENYPIILDGVTATLDEYHTSRLIEHIKNTDGQSIIFANTKEKKVFEGKLGNDFKNIMLHKNKNSNELKVEE